MYAVPVPSGLYSMKAVNAVYERRPMSIDIDQAWAVAKSEMNAGFLGGKRRRKRPICHEALKSGISAPGKKLSIRGGALAACILHLSRARAAKAEICNAEA